MTFPADARTIVGYVTSVGRQDMVVVDVEPQIIMRVQLLGEIAEGRFHRGVNASPVVGDDAWLAVRQDFETIFGSFDRVMGQGQDVGSFVLGKFAGNTDFLVRVLGGAFFGKHVAILGNSGAGKSCTTAKLLEEAARLPQSQVVVFDMHGEYRSSFSDENGRLDANVVYLGSEDLVLPYWLLRYSELEELFVDQSNPLHVSSQISFLRTALLEFKKDAAEELGLARQLTLDTPIYFSLDRLKTYAENLNDARYVLNSEHLAFSKLALRSMPPAEQQKMMRKQRCEFNRGNPEGETQHPLFFGKLLGLIGTIESRLLDRRYEFLLRPVDHAKGTSYFREHLSASDTGGRMSQVMSRLIELLTGRGAAGPDGSVNRRSNLTILDLSGIPFDVVDITVAVITRILFDLNFWTPSDRRQPILLIYEEAHNYIPRTEGGGAAGRNCKFAKPAVERVAKEGRKYGVSAMIISQRPSEVSETVLAQCNNMVIMRLNNPDDQQYVTRVVSDHFGSLLKTLPLLRPGEGFVIGDSVLMPLRTLIDRPKRMPRSGDVDFFKCWADPTPGLDITDILDYWWRQDRRLLNQEFTAAHGEIAAPSGKSAPQTAPPRTPALSGR